MMNEIFKNKLEGICENVLYDEPMKKHITFRVGGNADAFVSVSNEKEIIDIINLCKEANVDYYIIGNGSNLLVYDDGYRGLIIEIGKSFADIKRIDDETFYADSGVLLSRIAVYALENELAGFECLSGIPGTLGGGVVMNAGAYGGELKDVVESVKVLDDNGDVFVIKNEDMKFGYRNSVVKEKGYVVLGATIRLRKGNAEEIKSLMSDFNGRRRDKQPLEYPSAGSTFKRPQGYFAGKLIEDSGLRGYAVGGAQVSEKHCGFVINKGDATCSDVLNLIEDVKNKVFEDSGVTLEREVKIIGE